MVTFDVTNEPFGLDHLPQERCRVPLAGDVECTSSSSRHMSPPSVVAHSDVYHR
jgi:hypothetical protein